VFSTKRRPILWNVENQMTGDTIHLISNPKTEKLDSLLVFNNAFIISKDTISKSGFNQIFGIKLTGLFNDENKLREVDIVKNAESIFYVRNDKQELIGIDKAKSGSISIVFADGDIEEYTRYNQVDGNLYPESKYPEKEKQLKGFDWREDERPLSVEDLFKDDEPLVLSTIKGLDDYIPQDAFFDEELLERIKLAGQDDIVNKAGRNIPDEEGPTANLLEFNQNFNAKEWQKVATKFTSEKVIAPKGKATAFTIVGTGSSDGYILTVIKKTKGTFKWSIWLKGSGTTRMRFQENGGDYTNYSTLPINLTDEWTKYTLTGEKVDDGNNLRCIISDIQTNDSISLWGTKLVELSKK
jgi:hypothetical protein